MQPDSISLKWWYVLHRLICTLTNKRPKKKLIMNIRVGLEFLE